MNLRNMLKEEKYKKIVKITFLVTTFVFSLFVVKNTALNLFDAYDSVEVSTKTTKKLPIYCVSTEEKKVALSFDAAWGADDTDNILKTLKDNDVRATFFLCGYWVDKYPEEVKKIAADGHDVGNHGNTHAHGAQISLEQNKKEIMEVHEKIKNLLGVEMNLFRPPFGEYNNNVIDAAKASGYYTIQWDVDTLDIKKEVTNTSFCKLQI